MKQYRRLSLFLFAVIAAGLSVYAFIMLREAMHPGIKTRVRGIVWQPDNATVDIRGHWEWMGASQLLVQWIVVDGIAFVPNAGLATAPRLPDWKRIAEEPWAKEVILGLAGRFSESEARGQMSDLAALSVQLSRLQTPLNVVGWYFPVEIDPTWRDARQMAPLLAQLPRPLWVSVYDNANVGADVLSDWLLTWLPSDVGIFFQDGVGVHARDASTARHYANILSKRLGESRVRIIVEAFRPDPKGGFRAATATEVASQITAYDGYHLYLFDGPHYLSDNLLIHLKQSL